MKENNGFNTENNIEYNDDARAVNESELLPIYDTMHFSGDIQPVEDIEISEYEKTSRSKERGENRKTETNKKINPILSALNTLPKKIIASILVVVIAVAAVTGTVLGIVNSGKNEANVKSVYSVGSKMQMMLADGETYSLTGAEEVKVSDDGMMLYFSKNTASKTGKFDLRAVNIGKKRSLKKEGSFIDNGVDEGWQINSDGSFLCYSKTESGIKNFYIYNALTGKKELISSDVEEVFLPSKGDVIYFTRRISSIYSLHRMRFGENSQNVASGIDYVNFCDSDEGFEVLYTVQTGNELNVDVFIVKNYENPVEVCSDVSEVYANDYTYKGNLYYFTKNKSTVNWQDFINDTYYESDVNLQRPLEGDFLVEKGFIFKRYVLDTSAYNAAVAKYKAKQKRDSIREELDKIDLGLSVKDEYTCFVYNGLTTKKLASGVLLDNVVDYSVKEAPRLIYRKSVISVDNKITMDKLVELSSDGSVSDAIDYVREKVGKSYDLSNDCIYSWYDGTKVLEYPVKGYDIKKTEFILASGNVMYALSEGELYCNEISASELSSGTLIDTNVADCNFSDGYLYYSKAEIPEKLSLYRYNVKDGKQHIGDDMYSYFVADSSFVLLLTKPQADNELMNIGLFSDGKYTMIDTDASLSNFVRNNKTFAYLKNVGASENHNSGDMFVYSPEDGVKKADENVNAILYIN